MAACDHLTPPEGFRKPTGRNVIPSQALRGDWPARILGEIEGILQARLDRFYRFRKRAGGVHIRPLSIGSMFSGP